MTVLVTGGAGYIGSHMVQRLLDDGRAVVVVDDLSTGHQEVVPDSVALVVADVGDETTMRRVMLEYGVDAVIHFAAKIQVAESVTDPRLYWTGNVAATARLLECVLDTGVSTFIFSSTAAVYGVPDRVPIVESMPTNPINPYGETKLAIERMLAAYGRAYDLRYAALRYFNAAGADADRGLGERHDPETHLVPIVLDAAAGKRPHVTVFGRDYDTPDGTCVRDYIHVMDLAEAHLAALIHLEEGGESGVFNLGTGVGHSVAEVIEMCREITGQEIPVVEGARRQGDPAALVASPQLAEERLGWRAKCSDLPLIVADAWRAHRRAGGRSALPSQESPRHKEKHANVR